MPAAVDQSAPSLSHRNSDTSFERHVAKIVLPRRLVHYLATVEETKSIALDHGDAVSLRVLLVEDNNTAAMIAQAAVEKAGRGTAEVLRAETLAKALDIVRSVDVHLVLLDLNLPDSTGLKTLERMRVATRGPIIVITSENAPGLDEEALCKGAFEILHKGMLGPDSIVRVLRLAEGQRRVQQSLEDIEHRYQQLIEVSPDAIFVHSDWRITLVNPAMLRLFRAERSEQLLGREVLELIAPGSREVVRAGIRRLYEERQPVPFTEVEYLRVDGTRFNAEVTSASFICDGRPAAQVVARDITARKQAEKALRAAEEQFRGLVEQTIAGIYIIQDGKLAYVNPRYAEIFGYDSADELIGRDAFSLVAERDRAIQAERLRQWLEGGPTTASAIFTGVRKDGTIIDVGVHGARATHRGRPAIIGLLQDISEKKRAEEQIQRYVRELQTAFMSTVEVAMLLSEMRDPYTAGHERQVGKIAAAIGAELGFDEQRIEGLRVAGYLHDIGKITVPTEILTKPGKLSAIEFQLVKSHAEASYSVLKDVKFPWPVADVALQHHERMDGSGYPRGLKGDAIILEARIMAVADVVEAMSSHRPYRPSLGIAAALAEIGRGRGTVYDPAVVDACLKLFREERFAFQG